MIVLDTHATLWWISAPEQLSAKAASAIAAAETIGLPAISFWEIAMLLRKKKIAISTPMGHWTEQVLSIPRVRSLPLTPQIAVAAEGLAMHADPADRFIAATAIHYAAVLITKDALIRDVPNLATLW